MATKPPLLSIGPFSRLAGVTIKTLRFYDSAGLFLPVWTDPRTGYRFYSASQLPLLRRIRRRRLMVAVARAEQRLQQLDAWVAPVPSERLSLLEREIAATPAFTIRDSVRSGSDDIHRMFESAEREVARRGSRASQSPFLLLHDMDYHRPHIDVEVCVPVNLQALGSAGVRLVEPIARAACVRFQGGYEQAPVLFDTALDSLHGPVRLAGPIREVYLRFGADQRGYALDPKFLTDDVRQYRTESQIPVR